jgi:hypothetical protein
MLITTVAALVYQVIRYFINKEIVLLIVSVLLILLAGFMVYEVSKSAIYRRKPRLGEKADA